MTPAFVFFGLVGLIEVYYWFVWLPRNKYVLGDFEHYVDQIWKKGRGIK